jgi:anaerobic magnesium-protoporphyrin IX monomethyl ester cyclase
MRIVFVNPATSHEQIYGDWDLSAVDTYCPPLGLLYLASYVRRLGHHPVLFDHDRMRATLAQLVALILREEPDLIGITAKTINIHSAARIARELKQAGAKAPIVIGGSHFTAEPRRTMEMFPDFDYGVYGEGELTLAELLNSFSDKSAIGDVAGLVWRDANDQAVVNPPRPLIPNLDVLPFPAWDLLPGFPERYPHSALESKRTPAASLMASRGCPYQCTFCDRALFGSRVREHGAEYTLEMMRILKRTYGVRDLMIVDDNFALNKGRLEQVCQTMLRENMDFTWYCQGHVRFATEDRLKMMREAGCWFLELGLESGCDRILKLIKKGATKEQGALAASRAREAGLKVKGNFIFGLPGETLESMRETTEFACEIPLTHFQQNFLTIWPGCELSRVTGAYGISEMDWSRMAHQRVTFIPHGLTEADLIRASKTAFRKFYMRPRIVMEFARSVSSIRTATTLCVGFATFCKSMWRS